ncbi:MAG: hypothetical protein HYZ91_07015 [Candidatus Omnitrophica bacterium]|nr:hypothetical protein [Candidatus Omnitrophota bacterium]
MTPLRVAKWLRAVGRRRGRHASWAQRGQIAVAFLVFMALILLLAASTMNLGEVARLKTATANAADAGALAGASWVASGTNELALIAQAQWLNWWIVQLIFVLPFCDFMLWVPPVMIAILWLVNFVILKQQAADLVIKAAWENAPAAALFTAIQNAWIDDTSGEVNRQIQELSDHYQATRTLPSSVTFNWTRKGADKVARPSWVQIDVSIPGQRPELKMGGWSPAFWFWTRICIIIPPFINCCFPAFGWNSWSNPGKPGSSIWTAKTIGGVAGAAWSSLKGYIPMPHFGGCGYMTCVPFGGSIPGVPVRPTGIANSTGDFTVTVRHHREGGGALRFWAMRYPNEVFSSATAHYGGAKACGPFNACDDGEANLTVIQ